MVFLLNFEFLGRSAQGQRDHRAMITAGNSEGGKALGRTENRPNGPMKKSGKAAKKCPAPAVGRAGGIRRGGVVDAQPPANGSNPSIGAHDLVQNGERRPWEFFPFSGVAPGKR
jgi:hypothetical protein